MEKSFYIRDKRGKFSKLDRRKKLSYQVIERPVDEGEFGYSYLVKGIRLKKKVSLTELKRKLIQKRFIEKVEIKKVPHTPRLVEPKFTTPQNLLLKPDESLIDLLGHPTDIYRYDFGLVFSNAIDYILAHYKQLDETKVLLFGMEINGQSEKEYYRGHKQGITKNFRFGKLTPYFKGVKKGRTMAPNLAKLFKHFFKMFRYFIRFYKLTDVEVFLKIVIKDLSVSGIVGEMSVFKEKHLEMFGEVYE